MSSKQPKSTAQPRDDKFFEQMRARFKAIHALFETAAARAGFTLGAIPSDVQVDDARETREKTTGGCLSMALPAPIRAGERASEAQLELPRLK